MAVDHHCGYTEGLFVHIYIFLIFNIISIVTINFSLLLEIIYTYERHCTICYKVQIASYKYRYQNNRKDKKLFGRHI